MSKLKLSKSWTTVTPLSKALALIIFIIFPFVGFYFGVQYQKAQIPLPRAALAYKTYQDPEGLFSFQYPADWRIDFIGKEQDNPSLSDQIKQKKDLTIGGKEGKISFYWGQGFGGACPPEYGKIKLKQETLPVCHSVSEDNSQESWTQITKVLQAENIGLGVEAYADGPEPESREVVLRILSSLQFNPSK